MREAMTALSVVENTRKSSETKPNKYTSILCPAITSGTTRVCGRREIGQRVGRFGWMSFWVRVGVPSLLKWELWDISPPRGECSRPSMFQGP